MSESEVIKSQKEEIPETRLERGISRREFLKTAGMFALLTAGRPKEAAAWIEQKLNQGQEAAEGKPRIRVEILYGAHRTEKDIGNLAARVQKADVVAPEERGWSEEVLDILRGFTTGNITPAEFFRERGLEEMEEGFKPYIVGLAEALYNSQKMVVIFDLPEEHPLSERVQEHSGLKISYREPFPKIIEAAKNWIKKFALLQKERENYMLRQLRAFKERVENGEVEELKGKREIVILLSLGAAHTGIYHKLKKAGEDTAREFSLMPFTIASFHEEAIRRVMFGKEIDDKLAAQSVFWQLLWNIFEDRLTLISANTHHISLFLRRAVRVFNYDEIQKIFEKIREKEWTLAQLRLTLKFMLEEKGLELPSSEEELMTILKKKTAPR